MNHYETSVPRIALGIAAVAMTAITIGISVVVPAKMDSSREPRMLAASKVTAPASNGLVPATSIDVVAVREPGLSTVVCNPAKPHRALEG